MSTEETNLKMPAPDAAMQEALKLAFKALSAAAGHAAPMLELAFTATAWGANLVEEFQKQAENEASDLKAEVDYMVGQLEDAISNTAEPELKLKLEKVLASIDRNNPQNAPAALAAANAALSEARAGGFSSEAQARRAEINQLWQKIDHLNEEIKKDMTALSPYLTDEEKEEEARLKEALKNAKTDEERAVAEKALLVHQGGMFTSARAKAVANDDVGAIEKADRGLNNVNQAKEHVDQVQKKQHELNVKANHEVGEASPSNQNQPGADPVIPQKKAVQSFAVAEADPTNSNKAPSNAPQNTPRTNDFNIG